ncbi:hypothetical protein SEVIR_7G154550v4 [Setaria viridis]
MKLEMRALKGCAQMGRRWTRAPKASACAGRSRGGGGEVHCKMRASVPAAKPEPGRRQPARCCLLPAASRCTSSASIVDGHTHLRCCGSGAVAVGYTRAATSCTKPPPPSTGGAAEAASLATAAMAKNASGARDEAGGKEEGVAAWPRGLPRHSQSSD